MTSSPNSDVRPSPNRPNSIGHRVSRVAAVALPEDLSGKEDCWPLSTAWVRPQAYGRQVLPTGNSRSIRFPLPN
jgi:hypothetical protein